MSTQPEHPQHTETHDDPSVYLKTLIILLILTAITVGAAGIQFGSSSANVVIALTIASIKAILVALFFMHLKHDRPVNSIIAIAGFIFLGIFLMFDLLDFGTRVDLKPFNMSPPAALTEPILGASPAGKEGDHEKAGEKGGEKGGEKAPEKASEKK